MANPSSKFHELWATHGRLVGDPDEMRIGRSGDVARVVRWAILTAMRC